MSIKEALKGIFRNKETRAKYLQIFTKPIPDKPMLKFLYYISTGKKVDLENPKTLNEKIQWYKLNYRDPLMTRCADKYAVRSYVEECGLGFLLSQMIGAYNNADEIPFESLPEKCYIKCNHNSDGNFLWDSKRENDIPAIRKHLNKMLKNNAFYSSREWCYKNIQPRIIVEELLENRVSDEGLIDINIFCFNGEPKMVLYNRGLVDSTGGHAVGSRAVFDAEFNELQIETAMKSLPFGSVKKPAQFEDMIAYAKILSKPFPFVRVDFFYTVDKVYFGELTFYTAGGYGKYAPDEWNYTMGDWFVLPEKKQ